MESTAISLMLGLMMISSCLLNSGQAADGCDPHCASGCTSTGAGNCDRDCELGYALEASNHKCFACDENCDLTVAGCSKPFTCDQKCQPGFYLSKSPKGDKTCLPCDENCAGTCNKAGPFTCDEGQCEAGYTTHQKTKTCRPCGNNCDIAVGCNQAGPGRCDKCESGYTLSNNACYPSSANTL